MLDVFQSEAPCFSFPIIRYTGHGNPDGERVTPFKQTGNLTQKGDHDFNMKRNEFTSVEDKSQKQVGPEDHLRPLSGTMYQYKTEVQRWYKPYAYVDHPTKVDAPDHLFQDGELDMQTHKQQEFREYNYNKRQGPVKSEDTLKPLQGKLRSKSETRKQFEGHTGERALQARPSTGLSRKGFVQSCQWFAYFVVEFLFLFVASWLLNNKGKGPNLVG